MFDSVETKTYTVNKKNVRSIVNELVIHALTDGELKFLIDDYFVVLQPEDMDLREFTEVLKLLYPKAFH